MAHARKPAQVRPLWTEAAFLALPETNQRVELLDGEMVCESPTDRHQEIVGNLHAALHEWARRRDPSPTVRVGPLDIRFAPGRILQPDICVFLEPLARNPPMPLARIPDLCIEVVSSDRTYDRITKRLVYAEAAVREAWTIVPDPILVERWTGPRLGTSETMPGRIESPLLPGFSLDVATLVA